MGWFLAGPESATAGPTSAVDYRGDRLLPRGGQGAAYNETMFSPRYRPS
jgi:hypothetical protein